MHPTLRSTLVLLVAAVGLFLLSASGQDSSYWQSGPEWLGSIGWIGFLLCVLLLIVSGIFALVLWMRHRDQPLQP
jgi:ribose/xylose/arabinose/galactoside ABC-type transport system permease subunit